MKLILASASPRRVELLKSAGFDFDVIPADVDESLPQGMRAADAVRYLARKKALAVAADHPDAVVLGADTMVEIDGISLGKPVDEKDAHQMLMTLSGKRHRVHTGVHIEGCGFDRSFTETSEVEFFPFDTDEAKNYIRTGEPMDKAGAYAIQGRGMIFVKSISGDYNTIVGLPAAKVARILKGLPM